MNSVLAYRNIAQERGVARPQMIWPETAHPAFTKGAHLFGLDVDRRAGRPGHDDGRHRLRRATTSSPSTAMLIGTAGNYAYGTIDPIAELSDLALEHGHLPARGRAAWAASSCPGARSSGTPTSQCSTSACPG